MITDWWVVTECVHACVRAVCDSVCVCVCVWKKEYTQVHTGVGEIVSAVPTIDSKRNAHILITLLRHLA